MKISDQIEVLAGSRRSLFLSNELYARGHFGAAFMVDDWAYAVASRASLVEVWADFAGQDGSPVLRNLRSPAFLQARDQWCLDYADFLREFGL